MKSHKTNATEKALAKARRKAAKLGIDATHRQILLCYDKSAGKCASKRRMRDAWRYLKRRSKELKLRKRGGVLLTKAKCVDICVGGPIAVVYPDGIWYGACDPPVLERVLVEHVLGGQPVDEFIISQPPCDPTARKPR